MSANFLHGIESTEIKIGARSVRTVKSALIGLVGAAPVWSVAPERQSLNQIVMTLSPRDAALSFGQTLPGYTIPQALEAIYAHGSGEVMVVNVFDATRHYTAVSAEATTFGADGTAQLANTGVLAVSTITSADGSATYLSTDYAWSNTGRLTRTANSGIPPGASVKVSYRRADPSKVTAADIIGGIDSLTGAYSGLRLFEIAYTMLGAFPKLLIAPTWSEMASVGAALTALAGKIRAIAYIDAPVGATPQQCIEGRGPAGTTVHFATSSGRAMLCYPRMQIFDTVLNANRLEPLSSIAAGITAATDRDEGFWVSPSNHEIKGIDGVERLLTARLNDSATEVNAVNEVGITTVMSDFGTGYRLWGNRTAAWPSDPHPRNFLAVRRTGDMIMESVEFSMLEFLDRPITPGLLDSVLESVAGYMRTMVARNALVDGRVWIDSTLNPPDEIALGHVTWSVDYMPTIPCERMTFEYFMDVNMLKSLTGK